MTTQELELKRLKEAFERWAIKTESDSGRYSTSPNASHIEPDEIAAMFWPFVAYALSDMQGSAEKMAMLNRFKAALGMELMEHEKFGVEVRK
jgi:hypothetical protein